MSLAHDELSSIHRCRGNPTRLACRSLPTKLRNATTFSNVALPLTHNTKSGQERYLESPGTALRTGRKLPSAPHFCGCAECAIDSKRLETNALQSKAIVSEMPSEYYSMVYDGCKYSVVHSGEFGRDCRRPYCIKNKTNCIAAAIVSQQPESAGI